MVKRLYLIIFLILLIFIFIYLAFYFYNDYQIQEVYVASRRIMQREKINEEDLKIVKIPKKYIPKGTILNKQDIVGRYNVYNNIIFKDAFFNFFELEDLEKSNDRELFLLAQNQVLYSLSASEVRFSSIKLNQKFDLYVSFNKNGELVSDLLISNIKVVSLYDYNDEKILNNEKDKEISKLVFAIDKKLINILNKVRYIGEISIFNTSFLNDNESVLNEKSLILNYLD